MAKKYVNGYAEPRIVLNNNGSISVIDFSYKIQRMLEAREPISEIIETLDGDKSVYIDYYNYEWLLDYSDSIEASDLLKYESLENLSGKSGVIITLIPHKEVPWRSYEVLVKPERREIGLNYHHFGKDNTTNRDYTITFINAKRINSVQTIDADYSPVISCISFHEF